MYLIVLLYKGGVRMKKYMNLKMIISFGLIILFFVSSLNTFATEIENNQLNNNFFEKTNFEGNKYDGFLRIYVVEKESRWRMENGASYHNSLFDFAFNDEISIRYLDTYEDTINWQGDIKFNNVIVMAAVFNSDSSTNYADPPFGRPFDAHFVDAAASALPDSNGSNFVNDEFTHTIFCEKGTATWCPACPSMASELKSIYDSGEYPFLYVSMVVDESNDADLRMNDFNLKWLPSAFYDGGEHVVIGGGAGKDYHKNLIETSGKRDVHELDLKLTVNWIGSGEMDITISITNNEAVENNPPNIPSIDGQRRGNTSTEYEYTFSTIDPDGDDVYYYIDWGDNTNTDWLGPFKSGEEVKSSHAWNEDGVYIVKIKSKDLDEAESDWGTIEINMPRVKNNNRIPELIIWLFEKFNFLQPFFN
jgi:hypothetical protein